MELVTRRTMALVFVQSYGFEWVEGMTTVDPETGHVWRRVSYSGDYGPWFCETTVWESKTAARESIDRAMQNGPNLDDPVSIALLPLSCEAGRAAPLKHIDDHIRECNQKRS